MTKKEYLALERVRKREVNAIIKTCVKTLDDFYELLGRKDKLLLLKIESIIEDIKSVPRIYDDLFRTKAKITTNSEEKKC